MLIVSLAAVIPLAAAAACMATIHDGRVTTLPRVAAIDIYRVFVDATPMTVTIPAAGERAIWHTTAEDVRGSSALWRRMHLAN